MLHFMGAEKATDIFLLTFSKEATRNFQEKIDSLSKRVHLPSLSLPFLINLDAFTVWLWRILNPSQALPQLAGAEDNTVMQDIEDEQALTKKEYWNRLWNGNCSLL